MLRSVKGLKHPDRSCLGAKPKLVVFDLDACLWTPEMFQLPSMPNVPIKGDLHGGQGVVGLKCGKRGPTVELYEGALLALQELCTSQHWKETKIAAASSSLEPSYSYACLQSIEIFPGVNLSSVFSHLAIGREGELSPDKKTHFTKIHKESGIHFKDMLFFDDCIWGDNVQRVDDLFGVVGVRTPNGIQKHDWENGLKLYAERWG
mmetsp:Transcript_39702/g.64442  ORF Transcript_39702/g.64442 Transcript_39702/m.64442 type:complete len:205 (+) Transcript_39702:242-856(+)